MTRIAVSAAALTALLGAHAAVALFVEPQALALGRLAAASNVPIEVHGQGGAPRALRLDVAAPAGATPTARAMAFLDAWREVFDQGDPALDLVPVAAAHGAEDVVLFQQRFRGIPLFGGRVAVAMGQSAAGGPPRVLRVAGWLLPVGTGLDAVDTVPAILPETAEDAARTALGRPAAPVAGETALLLFDRRALGETAPPEPDLVWRVTLGGGDPEQLLVDAHTGAIAFQHALSETSSGLDDYDADFEDANGGTMVSTNCFNPTTIDDTAGDEDGLITPDYINDPELGALWWYTRETYLDYHDKLGRHSWDDDDGEIVVYSHIGLDSNGNPNASFNNGCEEFEFHDLYVAKDVVAHEFTHGVIRSSLSNLVYQGQSGALNEAFADSMAALVVDDDDWTMAEGLLNGGGPIRSLADPLNGTCKPAGGGSSGACNDPDRFSLFVNTSSDKGGVHTNSGIQNKATFLMAQGGSFNGVNVTGMGRSKASLIVYALAQYLQPSTATFSDARNQAVGIAQSLSQFQITGITAADVCTVRNAYAAVELGNADQDCNGIDDNVDDADGDGVVATQDNCPNLANPSQIDFDQDGIGDACDSDDDADGIPDGADKCPGLATGWYANGDPDGDGTGRACDPDDDNDGVPDDGAPGSVPCDGLPATNCDDNCVEDPNPTQFDGNHDGAGDACDPDQDGDGYYVLDDNCTFVYNPAQTDSDGDGMGDACDKCPDTSDNANAYTTGFPELGIDPAPLQPDSDGDGTPDACDTYAFGNAGLSRAGSLYNPSQPLRPDGARQAIDLIGDPGITIRVPIDVCDPSGDPDGWTANEYVELVFTGLPTSVQASVVDDQGGVGARSLRDRTLPTGGTARGMRFKPRCDRRWFLELVLGSDFAGASAFTLIPDVVPGGDGTPNPWSSIPLGLTTFEPAPEPDAALGCGAAAIALAGLARRRSRWRDWRGVDRGPERRGTQIAFSSTSMSRWRWKPTFS